MEISTGVIIFPFLLLLFVFVTFRSSASSDWRVCDEEAREGERLR